MAPAEFIAMLQEPASAMQSLHGIPWEVTVAQAALETGWLARPIADRRTGKDTHNLFGIKADTSWHGPYCECDTFEYVNGKRRREVARFRAYADYAESMDDRARFLTENPRYRRALEVADDPKAFARELQAAGYATDPRYAERVIDIMRQHMGVA